MDAKVYCSVLGTVRAMRGHTRLDVGPPKRLALLSLLVLLAPGPVSLRDASCTTSSASPWSPGIFSRMKRARLDVLS